MSETFEEAWARCAPWLDAALAHAGRTHSLDDVKAMVEGREARLWAGRAAALVTQVQDHPRTRWLLVWLGGGGLEEITGTLLPAAEAWGRAQGCTGVVVIGRPGWARVLAPANYSESARIVAKEL